MPRMTFRPFWHIALHYFTTSERVHRVVTERHHTLFTDDTGDVIELVFTMTGFLDESDGAVGTQTLR